MMKAARRSRISQARGRQVALAVATVAFSVFIVFAFGASHRSVGASMPVVEPPPDPPQDFSKFRHDTPQHTRMPCLVCHVRKDNSPTLRMPGHVPCSSCHVQQFAEGNTNPICYICHTQTDVKPFPGLKSFTTKFDHGSHTRLTNCATCHRPSRRGVALSIPSGANAHTTCFQCHTPESGQEVRGERLGSCRTCHTAGTPGWTRETSKAFSLNFSHTEHGRRGLNCADCHTIRAGMPRGRQVTSPVASMHFPPAGVKSCGACHNNQRAFGGTDFSDCKRCHEGKNFNF